MAQTKITKKFVETVPLSERGQTLFWDSDMPGFGVCVGKKYKSYIVQRDIRGRPIRVTIGKHGVWTPDTARREAQSLLLNMAQGRNPIEEKRLEKARNITLQTTFDDYIKSSRGRLSAGTIVNYQDFADNQFKDWLNRPLREITKEMIVDRHQYITTNSGRSAANSSMQFLRALFRRAMTDDESLLNPVIVLSQRKLWNKVERRRSYVREHDLHEWYGAVMDLQNTSIKDALRFLLFTGLRKNEAFALRWEDVDMESKTFKIPKTKNGKSHELPMTTFLYDLLQRRKETRGLNPWVFPGNGKNGNLTEPRAAIRQIVKGTGIKFMPHDLRRTFITIAAQLGIPNTVLKRLMNHSYGNSVTDGYIVTELHHLQMPMQLITDRLLELTLRVKD